MRTIFYLCIALVVFTISVASLFGFAQHVTRNDARLFQAADNQHIQNTARSCVNGTLWQSTVSGEYACLHRHTDGALLMQSAPETPQLNDRHSSQCGTLLVRK